MAGASLHVHTHTLLHTQHFRHSPGVSVLGHHPYLRKDINRSATIDVALVISPPASSMQMARHLLLWLPAAAVPSWAARIPAPAAEENTTRPLGSCLCLLV